MAVASACTKPIPCASKTGSSGKVMSPARRLPNGSQISDGLNRKRSAADTTVTSTSPPSSALTSRAAVSPPKFPPITSTRLFPMTITPSCACANTELCDHDQSAPADRGRVCGHQAKGPSAPLASSRPADRASPGRSALLALAAAGDRADGWSQRPPEPDRHDHGRDIAERPDPGFGSGNSREDHQQPRADEERRTGRDNPEEVIHQAHHFLRVDNVRHAQVRAGE